MPSDNRYVLSTGEEAASRLRIVNLVHGPDTERFLGRAGLAPGMRAVDVGCGIGTITAWLARQVGPRGEVVGVDISPEQVAAAEAAARKQGIPNARFIAAPAHETGLPKGSFDLAYCRFVLMHVPDPAAALREMRSLLRPGGILACEDSDFTSPFCEPPSPAFDRSFELYRAVGEQRGLDFRIGPRLYRLFLNAGFRDPQVSLAQPAFTRGEPKRLPDWTLTECAPALVEAGLAAPEEIDRLAAEVRALAEDETTLFGMARMTQVWARRD